MDKTKVSWILQIHDGFYIGDIFGVVWVLYNGIGGIWILWTGLSMVCCNSNSKIIRSGIGVLIFRFFILGQEALEIFIKDLPCCY
jgi:hypothetical protein